MQNVFLINDIIDQYALNNNLRSFYPSAIVHRTGLTTTEVIHYLDTLVANGTLDLNFEIRCLDDISTITTVADYGPYIGKNLDCYSCGETIEVKIDNIFPVYSVSEAYKKYVKSKNRIKKNKVYQKDLLTVS